VQVLAARLRNGNESHLDCWAAKWHKTATDVVDLTDPMTRMATVKSSFGQSLCNTAVAFVAICRQSAPRLPAILPSSTRVDCPLLRRASSKLTQREWFVARFMKATARGEPAHHRVPQALSVDL